MSRPSIYTEELADKICELLEENSLRSICARDGMPDRVTVNRWLASKPDFAARYARAREAQADHEHEEMIEIEKKTLSGELDPKAANVVLGNKRWRMEKLKPKMYGSKIDLNHGGQAGNPISLLISEISGNAIQPVPDDE